VHIIISDIRRKCCHLFFSYRNRSLCPFFPLNIISILYGRMMTSNSFLFQFIRLEDMSVIIIVSLENKKQNSNNCVVRLGITNRSFFLYITNIIISIYMYLEGFNISLFPCIYIYIYISTSFFLLLLSFPPLSVRDMLQLYPLLPHILLKLFFRVDRFRKNNFKSYV
jgi:hypothetical protein